LNISVIIPTYNRAHVLARAIESVLAQTLKPAEIIVIDDGSEDGTAQLVRSRFPECRYVYQENRGVSCARNEGIQMARGDWLAFLDSDDEWLPGKLAAQKNELGDYALHRLCHTEEIWVRNGKRVNAMQKHAKSGGNIFKQCLPLCVISPSAAMIHRSVFEEVGLFDESLPACEDYDMWLRICSREAVSFVNIPQIRKYGGHKDQLSRHFWGMDRFRVQALESLLKEQHLHDSDRIATLTMLLEKLDILMNGSIKRSKQEAVTYYMKKKAHYAAMLMVASRNKNSE
jgi:glycosyltransferase involved in cell wall biosynthesis